MNKVPCQNSIFAVLILSMVESDGNLRDYYVNNHDDVSFDDYLFLLIVSLLPHNFITIVNDISFLLFQTHYDAFDQI